MNFSENDHRVKIFRKKPPQNNVQSHPIPSFHSNGPISLSDFVSNLILALWVISLSIFMEKVKRISVTEAAGYYNSLYLLGFLYYSNSFSGLVIGAAYIGRHQQMRNKLMKIIRKFIKM